MAGADRREKGTFRESRARNAQKDWKPDGALVCLRTPLALRARGGFQGSRITFFPTRRANKAPLKKERGGLLRTGPNYIAILNFYYLSENLLLPIFPVYENVYVLRADERLYGKKYSHSYLRSQTCEKT